VFSGLVQTVGILKELKALPGGARVRVTCSFADDPLTVGESIAVSGVCLTVAAMRPAEFTADLSSETLRRTTLGKLRPGSRVNLERSLHPSDRIGGHFVLGHVDATVGVVAVEPSSGFRTVRASLPPSLESEVAEKGSVALDGVSLTVSRLGHGWFEVVVIPTTLARTTLGERRAGDLLNLETDVLAKYVRRTTVANAGADRGALAGWGHEED